MAQQSTKIRALAAIFLAAICWFSGVPAAHAHHVLGRPSYALNEDSNTPSAMQVETQIGNYFVNYMVFPAFPRPNEAGRVNLYVRKLDGGAAFSGKIAFSVRDNSWAAWLGLAANEEKLGSQVLDDNVYRQGFVFRSAAPTSLPPISRTVIRPTRSTSPCRSARRRHSVQSVLLRR